jgi:hypothetical protein
MSTKSVSNGRATLALAMFHHDVNVCGCEGCGNDDASRRALTAIGSCTLNEYGSISGYYIAENGVKTCYLYPGK